MGLAGYISGKPKVSQTAKAIRRLTESTYASMGYDKAVEYWQGIAKSPAKRFHGKDMLSGRGAGVDALRKSFAPSILSSLDSMRATERAAAPQPTAIKQVESHVLGKKKAKKRGRGANIHAGRMMQRQLLNFGKLKVGE